MKVYVNCITSGAELRSDIKVLIPEMNLRRRMSRVVKSGVAAGIESLLEFGARAPIDAIITATGLGCIADSEKFLDGLIAGDETMLNPTPFIQSTFNTVGAQIALLRGLHCYNTTYAHRWTSFENALTDAALRIGAGWSQAVLVGAFDETTPSVEKVLQRLRVAQEGRWGESSVFFVLTAERFDCSVAEITGIRIPAGTPAADGGYPAGGETNGETGGEEKSRPERHTKETPTEKHTKAKPAEKHTQERPAKRDTKERAAGKRTIPKTPPERHTETKTPASGNPARKRPKAGRYGLRKLASSRTLQRSPRYSGRRSRRTPGIRSRFTTTFRAAPNRPWN